MCEVGLPQWEVPVFYVLGIYCQKFSLHFSSSDSILNLISIQHTRFLLGTGFNWRAKSTRLEVCGTKSSTYQCSFDFLACSFCKCKVDKLPTSLGQNICPKVVSSCYWQLQLYLCKCLLFQTQTPPQKKRKKELTLRKLKVNMSYRSRDPFSL